MSKKKQTTQNHSLKRLLLISLLAIQSLALVTLAVFLIQARQRAEEVSTYKLANFIVEAVRAESQPVVLDAASGRVYVYQARIVLPPVPRTAGAMRYAYHQASDSDRTDLRLISEDAFNQAKMPVLSALTTEQAFSNVAHLQACGRGYLLTTMRDSNTADMTLGFERQLRDGRTIYGYYENGCPENDDELTDYLKQVESY